MPRSYTEFFQSCIEKFPHIMGDQPLTQQDFLAFVEKAYFEDIKNNPAIIRNDVKELVNGFKEEGFKKYKKDQLEMAKKDPRPKAMEYTKLFFKRPFDAIFLYIRRTLDMQYKAADQYGESHEMLDEILLQKTTELNNGKRPKAITAEKIIARLSKELNDLSQFLPQDQDQYGKTLQGLLPNKLRQVGKRVGHNEVIKDDTLIFNSENAKLAFFQSDKYNGVAMTVPMQKVLSMLHEKLCKVLPANLEDLGKVTLNDLAHYTKVQISLDEYMTLTGTKDKKTARKTITEACDRLYHVSFVCDVKDKHYEGRLFETQVHPIRGGIYEMEYTTKYLRYCSTTTPASFHKGMYQINGKLNPYSWWIGQKLWQHFIQTRGKAGNNRLKVANLIAAVPDLPTYDEVMAGDRHVDTRIISPVERDLDQLKKLGVLKSWEYSNAKGAPLTADQLENIDYNTWSTLYISFVLDLPPQDKYIENHQKRIAARAEKFKEKTLTN